MVEVAKFKEEVRNVLETTFPVDGEVTPAPSAADKRSELEKLLNLQAEVLAANDSVMFRTVDEANAYIAGQMGIGYDSTTQKFKLNVADITDDKLKTFIQAARDNAAVAINQYRNTDKANNIFADVSDLPALLNGYGVTIDSLTKEAKAEKEAKNGFKDKAGDVLDLFTDKNDGTVIVADRIADVTQIMADTLKVTQNLSQDAALRMATNAVNDKKTAANGNLLVSDVQDFLAEQYKVASDDRPKITDVVTKAGDAENKERDAKKAYETSVDTLVADFADKNDRTKLDPARMEELKKIMINTGAASRGAMPDSEEYAGKAAAASNDVAALGALNIDNVKDYLKKQYDRAHKDTNSYVADTVDTAHQAEVAREKDFRDKANKLAEDYFTDPNKNNLSQNGADLAVLNRVGLMKADHGFNADQVKNMKDAEVLIQAGPAELNTADSLKDIKTKEDFANYLTAQWKNSNGNDRKAIEGIVANEAQTQAQARVEEEKAKAAFETKVRDLAKYPGGVEAVTDQVYALKHNGDRSGYALDTELVTDKKAYLAEQWKNSDKDERKAIEDKVAAEMVALSREHPEPLARPKDYDAVEKEAAAQEAKFRDRVHSVVGQFANSPERLEALVFNAAIASGLSNDKAKDDLVKMKGGAGLTIVDAEEFIVAQTRGKDQATRDKVNAAMNNDLADLTIDATGKKADAAAEVERARAAAAKAAGDIALQPPLVSVPTKTTESAQPEALLYRMSARHTEGIPVYEDRNMDYRDSNSPNGNSESYVYADSSTIRLDNIKNDKYGSGVSKMFSSYMVASAVRPGDPDPSVVVVAGLNDIARTISGISPDKYNGQYINIIASDDPGNPRRDHLNKSATLALTLTDKDMENATGNIKSVRIENGQTTVTLNDGRSVDTRNEVVFRYTSKDGTHHEMNAEEMRDFVVQQAVAPAKTNGYALEHHDGEHGPAPQTPKGPLQQPAGQRNFG